MHPALSVIVFTTASGAGYGLLALVGVGLALGLVPADRLFGAVSLGLALVLITAGLLSSTLHLGHPERAWRAFSQWRSSWLSREGVASVATYVPAVVLAGGWVLLGRTGVAMSAAGVVAAVLAGITVYTTSMIYGSLKTVPDWSNRFTPPAYLLLALMSGAVLLNALVVLNGAFDAIAAGLAIVLLLAGWVLKRAIWTANDSRSPVASTAAATGLAGGAVRSVEWPHTGENYVLKEMGYRVGRKHAAKLRRLTQLLAFALPAVLIAAGFLVPWPWAVIAAIVSVVSAAGGMLIERWLFFAEARHVAATYYYD